MMAWSPHPQVGIQTPLETRKTKTSFPNPYPVHQLAFGPTTKPGLESIPADRQLPPQKSIQQNHLIILTTRQILQNPPRDSPSQILKTTCKQRSKLILHRLDVDDGVLIWKEG